jgi:hypothetical protein
MTELGLLQLQWRQAGEARVESKQQQQPRLGLALGVAGDECALQAPVRAQVLPQALHILPFLRQVPDVQRHLRESFRSCSALPPGALAGR